MVSAQFPSGSKGRIDSLKKQSPPPNPPNQPPNHFTMKKLLTVLLALAVMAPSAFAVTPTEDNSKLLEQDLKDYLDFDSGTWWNYELRSEDHSNQVDGETHIRATQAECDVKKDCYTRESDLNTVTTYLENGVLYYYEMSGTKPSKKYIATNLAGYTQEIATEDYELFSLQGSEKGATISCSYDFSEAYHFQSVTAPAITEDCILKAEVDSTPFEIRTSEDYLKGVGTVASSFGIYVNHFAINEASQKLIDTSLLKKSPFSDVKLDDKHYPAIEYLYDQKVFQGYADGTFQPSKTINRAELLKILVEGKGVSPDASQYQNCFPDVKSDWYSKYVCYAKEAGWVSGYADGNFRPGNTVSKVEALKMLLLSQGITITIQGENPYDDVHDSDWFIPYVKVANELGLLEESGDQLELTASRTRSGVAENLYRLLLSTRLEAVSGLYAQTACLTLDTSLSQSEQDDEADDIIHSGGFEDYLELDDYLNAIASLPLFDRLTGMLESDLQNECGSELKRAGYDLGDLAEQMLNRN